MKPNCIEMNCVGLWGQFTTSMGSHWRFDGLGVLQGHQSIPTTVADILIVCSVHLAGEKVLKQRCNNDVFILEWGWV